MKPILHIAPQLPPAIDGVGDYCAHLRQHWPAESPLAFAVLRGADATQKLWLETPVMALQANAQALADVLDDRDPEAVVLHYVGYGYQPKGIPLWLPAGLEQWKRNSRAHLVTMFHEMYADSSPLRSPYWVKPWARRIIARLVALSDSWVTSCPRYFDWLVSEFGADPARGRRIVIGSNVPRASEFDMDRLWPSAFGRKIRVGIFGLPNTRLWALERHAELLAYLVRHSMIDEILLIGQSSTAARHNLRLKDFQSRIGGEWHADYDLPPDQIADALAGCDLGIVANDAGTLTKSGVFAAMATNGVVPIVGHSPMFTVPTPFNDCVLLNDGKPETFSAIASELKGENRMTARRRMTLRAAESELAWSRIATAWQDVLGAAGAEKSEKVRAVQMPSRGVLVHGGAG